MPDPMPDGQTSFQYAVEIHRQNPRQLVGTFPVEPDFEPAEQWAMFAAIRQDPQRNAAIERIAEVGRRQWRKEAGAHQQARAENGMFRYKRIIGDGLRARKFEAQKREAAIAVNVLNRMTGLGIPKSEAIAA